ncbi:MAG: AraC-like DNA-binding protein [Mucilaginibacter sp.]|nr:AraC-like DNA-binding protein [Mucilaginibacter sp.]
MNNRKESGNELTTFSMEELLKIPHGIVQEYNTPMKDREGHLKLVITDSMGIVDGVMIANKPTEALEHFNDRPFVEMNFMLEGNISQTNEGLLNQYSFKKGYHNILFNPYSIEKNSLATAGTHHIFSAHILPERMISLFSGYVPELVPFAEKIEKGEPFVLHSPTNGFNKHLKHFFDAFWDCPTPLSLRKIYFESKILELLCRQCEVLIGHETKEGNIPKPDLEKVYYARELLLYNLSNPPSLTELSRLCGLNEFKLKKYFKQVFDLSVFGLLHEERLQSSKQLIYQGEKNISMIAYELGYAHPQHFQRAFKKRFGITPKELLK